MITATAHSLRPVRATAQQRIADVTGTMFEPWADRLQGRFVRRDGRIVFEPLHETLPDSIVRALCDANPAVLPWLHSVEREAIRLAER